MQAPAPQMLSLKSCVSDLVCTPAIALQLQPHNCALAVAAAAAVAVAGALAAAAESLVAAVVAVVVVVAAAAAAAYIIQGPGDQRDSLQADGHPAGCPGL